MHAECVISGFIWNKSFLSMHSAKALNYRITHSTAILWSLPGSWGLLLFCPPQAQPVTWREPQQALPYLIPCLRVHLPSITCAPMLDSQTRLGKVADPCAKWAVREAQASLSISAWKPIFNLHFTCELMFLWPMLENETAARQIHAEN